MEFQLHGSRDKYRNFSELSVSQIKQQKRIIKEALQNSRYPANKDLAHCPEDMVDLRSVKSSHHISICVSPAALIREEADSDFEEATYLPLN